MLKMFTNGNDYIIAQTLEDAIKEWEKMIGDDYLEDGYGDLSDWEVYPSDKELTLIHLDDPPLPSDVPEGGKINPPEGYNLGSITASIGAWVKFMGKECYFAGTDW